MRYPLTLVCLIVLAACALAGEQQWRDPSPHQVRSISVDSSVRLEVLDWGGSGPRSADDVLGVLDALNLQQSVLVGHSCAGQVLTMFASQHSDRLSGLVYLDGAGDPTMTPADVGAKMPDPATLPRPIKSPPAPDNTSFEALRVSQRNTRGWAFPEAELRQQYVANSDGSVGRSLLSPVIRRAITVDARVKPDYSGVAATLTGQ